MNKSNSNESDREGAFSSNPQVQFHTVVWERKQTVSGEEAKASQQACIEVIVGEFIIAIDFVDSARCACRRRLPVLRSQSISKPVESSSREHDDDFTTGQIWLRNGVHGNFDSIEAGWTVGTPSFDPLS